MPGSPTGNWSSLVDEHTCTFGLFKGRTKNLKLENRAFNHRQTFREETRMKTVFLLTSAGILLTILGCSGNSPKTVSTNASATQAAVSPAGTSTVIKPLAALPVPVIGQAKQPAWRSENVKDQVGNAVALIGTSLDGKFDLVILQKGSYSFLSFVRHMRWESVRTQPAKGKLMYLRIKFEDGQEKRIEWDELGFATDGLCSVLWSYPAATDTPIGPAPQGAKAVAVGGDQLLIHDMIKHKTMLLEVEPGVTTQFDLTGLARELQKVRAPRTQPILEARQTAE
jgi:hypothetical protein